jgi:dephospho-CoA kinase
VTGAIGSGKSTVCREFARLGRKVLSADAIAREITDRDPAVRGTIRDAFGPKVFAEDGSLNRRQLASIVFRDARKRKRLNRIVHPVVFEELQQILQSLPATSSRPYVIIEAALVFETGMDSWLDYVIVVSAREKTRISRVMRRDRCTSADVRARIASQMPASEKTARGDFVVQNDGSTTELRGRIRFLDRMLRMVFEQ